jgi:hypothetical protein
MVLAALEASERKSSMINRLFRQGQDMRDHRMSEILAPMRRMATARATVIEKQRKALEKKITEAADAMWAGAT